MSKQPVTIEFSLPEWVNGYCMSYRATSNLSERMQFVIKAAQKNINLKTGGPFAAAIFEEKTGELVSLGVNLVTTQGMSILHAEMVAIAVAQKKLGTYDLGAENVASHELVSSTEPCAMCFGAVPWSGIRTVVTGAMDEDARNIGFDEGPKPDDWIFELASRGIKVIDKVERESAVEVLTEYKCNDGFIYNSRES
ncbi:MAG: nucleoside deaminase [Kangiellaceae bacterium]|nr:nucleoside deaminase [Kangiellaceae bacterium]MCW9000613.1 nucleoside deaminase [Kangiellaceae bacterium]